MSDESACEREQHWERDLAERAHAVALVRGRLGCACPEEVFDHYRVSQRVAEGLVVVELIMGERLLVWLIAGDRIVDPGSALGTLLRAGFEERNRRGLNRFRLVVVGEFPSWEAQWRHLADALDPKVHLHVIPEIGRRPLSRWVSETPSCL